MEKIYTIVSYTTCSKDDSFLNMNVYESYKDRDDAETELGIHATDMYEEIADANQGHADCRRIGERYIVKDTEYNHTTIFELKENNLK